MLQDLAEYEHKRQTILQDKQIENLMKESRFRWVTGLCAAVIVAITGMYIFAEKSGGDVSRLSDDDMVYIDYSDQIHTNRKCKRLNYKNTRVRSRITLEELKKDYYKTICPNCVSDDEHDQIIKTKKPDEIDDSDYYRYNR